MTEKTKNRPGRPRLAAEEKNSERFLVSLKTDDYINFCKLADEAGVSLSAFARSLIEAAIKNKMEGRA